MIDKEDEFKEYLRTTGVNGGFQVFVKGFPNGRLHPFIQRGGSEHKSRSFVMLNFQGDYRPDYGRKNLRSDCRGLVNELCKCLMRYGEGRYRYGRFLRVTRG